MSWTRILRQGLSYGAYDFANSGYYLVYTVLVFPLYLANVAMKGDPWFEAKWGIAQGASVFVAILLGLFLGVHLDRRGIRAVAPLAMLIPAIASLFYPVLVALHASGDLLLLAYAVINSSY